MDKMKWVLDYVISVVEHSTADPEASSSNPGVPLFFFFPFNITVVEIVPFFFLKNTK